MPNTLKCFSVSMAMQWTTSRPSVCRELQSASVRWRSEKYNVFTTASRREFITDAPLLRFPASFPFCLYFYNSAVSLCVCLFVCCLRLMCTRFPGLTPAGKQLQNVVEEVMRQKDNHGVLFTHKHVTTEKYLLITSCFGEEKSLRNVI